MLEIEVEKLIWRGRGLGRLPSGKRAIILPPVLPGERIIGEIVKEKKDYVEIAPKNILVSSKKRKHNPCPLSSQCGGCSFGFIEDNYQLKLKKELLKNEFNRAIKKNCITLDDVIVFPSPRKWGYRWRGQVFVHRGKPHFKQLNSSKLICLSRCLLFVPPLNENLLEMVNNLPDGKVIICASPFDHTVYTEAQKGPLILPFERYNIYLKISPGSFFQANWDLNQALIDFVTGAASPFERIADLYAGCGNFSLPLATLKKHVLIIEKDQRAIDAINSWSKKSNYYIELNKMNLFKENPVPLLEKHNSQCLIVDPPRSGGGRFVKNISKLKEVKRIIWISCDIINTARDISPLIRAGWHIKDIALFDMFPQTFHMEVVFVLDNPSLSL